MSLLQLKSTEFIQIIEDIVGKKYTFKIQLISDNILMYNKMYYANDAFESGHSSTSVGEATIFTASAMGDVSSVSIVIWIS